MASKRVDFIRWISLRSTPPTIYAIIKAATTFRFSEVKAL
jgi:hypothetical protein